MPYLPFGRRPSRGRLFGKLRGHDKRHFGAIIAFLVLFLIVSTTAVVKLQHWVAREHGKGDLLAVTRDLHALATGTLFLAGLQPGDITREDSHEREGPDGRWLEYRTEILVGESFPISQWLQELQPALERAGASLNSSDKEEGLVVEVRYFPQKREHSPPSILVETLLLKRRSRPAGIASRKSPDRPLAAIVIDDLGQNFSPLKKLRDLGIPLTISILPNLEHSRQISREAARLNLETLLHLPMEPLDYPEKNPGPGALLSGMSAAEIQSQLRDDLRSVPGVVGVNNHMGSRLTADYRAMETLVAELKTQGLFFLDSRTSPRSQAFEIARLNNLPVAGRDIFIDAHDDRVFIRGQLEKLMQLAHQRGSAIGIGHPYPNTISILEEMREELLASGVEWVPVSKIVQHNHAPRLTHAVEPKY